MTDRVAYTYIASPIRGARKDEHSLRCVFRQLVNGGYMFAKDYDHFVSIVDRQGSINLAIMYLNGVHDDILKSLRAVV